MTSTETSTSAPAAKRCCACGHRQPRDQFHRSVRRKDGLDPRCRSCSSVAHRQVPTLPSPPDPAPAVALREELAAARRAGETFTAAWAPAVAAARETSAPRERESWENALWSTRDAWEAAYDPRP